MRLAIIIVLAAGIAACGGGSAGPPSTPGTPVPPTPTPVPSPTPNPFAAACGQPLPSFDDAYGFGIKVQLEPTNNKKILNASPAVRNQEYCQAAGFPNTLICNTRKEDDPTRVPCDHYLSGISDEGRPGPNWFQDVGEWPNEQLVKCGETGTTCHLKEENQYLLDIFEVGRYVACGGEGGTPTCGDCVILTTERSTGSLGGLCKHR
jgi:hypothetical protein